jgi:peptidoglycan hydrolase-like protein with peptidoglycan-binding domain
MAYIEKGAKPWYNVEQAVGAAGANLPSDVALVQYMLRHYFGSEAAGLKVDGHFGPITQHWITRFQHKMQSQGKQIAVNGRVDRAPGVIAPMYHPGAPAGSPAYTILALNHELQTRNPGAYHQLPAQVPLHETGGSPLAVGYAIGSVAPLSNNPLSNRPVR